MSYKMTMQDELGVSSLTELVLFTGRMSEAILDVPIEHTLIWRNYSRNSNIDIIYFNQPKHSGVDVNLAVRVYPVHYDDIYNNHIVTNVLTDISDFNSGDNFYTLFQGAVALKITRKLENAIADSYEHDSPKMNAATIQDYQIDGIRMHRNLDEFYKFMFEDLQGIKSFEELVQHFNEDKIELYRLQFNESLNHRRLINTQDNVVDNELTNALGDLTQLDLNQ